MKPEIAPLPAGLYLVATPIGNARDITLRALDILASADVIAAEDTRTMRRLMRLHGVALGNRPLIAYHDHSGEAARAGIVKLIGEGRSVAYASEAGMPLIADPGFALAREVARAGFPVTSAPGPSASLAALSLSGLPSDRFLFAGFAPAGKSARRKWLAELLDIPATLILFESPKRVQQLLIDLCDLGEDSREMAICRELTKKFEEVMRATVSELRERLSERPLKGEIVLILGRGDGGGCAFDMEAALGRAMATMSIRDAVAHVAASGKLPRRKVYQAALALQEGKTTEKSGQKG